MWWQPLLVLMLCQMWYSTTHWQAHFTSTHNRYSLPNLNTILYWYTVCRQILLLGFKCFQGYMKNYSCCQNFDLWNIHTALLMGQIWFNPLAPKICGHELKGVIFKLLMQNISLNTHCKFDLSWIPHNLLNENFTLVQVMAWCHQETNHYLSQCWARSMLAYGITRPQCVK